MLASHKMLTLKGTLNDPLRAESAEFEIHGYLAFLVCIINNLPYSRIVNEVYKSSTPLNSFVKDFYAFTKISVVTGPGIFHWLAGRICIGNGDLLQVFDSEDL